MVRCLDFDLDKSYSLKKGLNFKDEFMSVNLEKGSKFIIWSYGVDRDNEGYYFYVTIIFTDSDGNDLEVSLIDEQIDEYIELN